MAEFINGQEAEAIKAKPRGGGVGKDPDSITGRLRAGEVLWLPDNGKSPTNRWQALKAMGYQQRTRRGERDGVKGVYVWAEPIEVVR